MAKDWIERRNIDFHQQARAFSEKIAADPGAYGIDPADAALLAADFADFDAKYRAAWVPLLRTTAAVLARDRARKALTHRMRALGARIRANPAVTFGMRLGLQMTIDGWAQPAPDAPPRSRPWINVVSLMDNRLTLRLKDSASSRRGKPLHYTGAQIFMHLGETYSPLVEMGQWRFLAVVSKTKATIKLPRIAAGTKVMLAARWYNTHGTGPTSQLAELWVGKMLTPPTLQAA